jgi:hypothetical protein
MTAGVPQLMRMTVRQPCAFGRSVNQLADI